MPEPQPAAFTITVSNSAKAATVSVDSSLCSWPSCMSWMRPRGEVHLLAPQGVGQAGGQAEPQCTQSSSSASAGGAARPTPRQPAACPTTLRHRGGDPWPNRYRARCAAELHHLAVGEHDLQTRDVVGGEPVLEAVGTAGLLGDVAVDRAHDLAPRGSAAARRTGRG